MSFVNGIVVASLIILTLIIVVIRTYNLLITAYNSMAEPATIIKIQKTLKNGGWLIDVGASRLLGRCRQKNKKKL